MRTLALASAFALCFSLAHAADNAGQGTSAKCAANWKGLSTAQKTMTYQDYLTDCTAGKPVPLPGAASTQTTSDRLRDAQRQADEEAAKLQVEQQQIEAERAKASRAWEKEQRRIQERAARDGQSSSSGGGY